MDTKSSTHLSSPAYVECNSRGHKFINLERKYNHSYTVVLPLSRFSSCVIFKVAVSYRMAADDPSKALPVTVSVGEEVPAVLTIKPLLPVTVLPSTCADRSNE